MLYRTDSKKRKARGIFRKMLFWIVTRDFCRDKVGAVTEKLSSDDRTALENLKPEDIQDRI